jgi:hypothetical protein
MENIQTRQERGNNARGGKRGEDVCKYYNVFE